jgi:hypothetical protein
MRGTIEQYWMLAVQNTIVFSSCTALAFFARCHREEISLEVKIQQALDRVTSPEWIDQRVACISVIYGVKWEISD